MPHFFFHYHTPHEIARDELGCSFETLELAYLDAYCSMVDMGAEMLKQQVDPSWHHIEIADGDGLILMELRFDEVFCHRRRQSNVLAETQLLRERLDHFRRLRADMQDACSSARLSVARAHETLRRARAGT